MAIRDAVQTLGIEVRAGLHTGECEVRGDDIGGIGVHIGARVSALAGPNDVLVSSTLRDLVIGSGLEFEDRGAHTLKGVPGGIAPLRRRNVTTCGTAQNGGGLGDSHIPRDDHDRRQVVDRRTPLQRNPARLNPDRLTGQQPIQEIPGARHTGDNAVTGLPVKLTRRQRR